MDVEYPGFGAIVVDGTRYEHDVVVEAGRVRKRKKGPSRPHRGSFGHTPLSKAEQIPWSARWLVIGTGASGRLPVMREITVEAESRAVALITLPTAEACELLRSLEDDDVSAILHVTC